jgi:predicted O-linked N-acetylglucosamine transferase (SPINDLY family)
MAVRLAGDSKALKVLRDRLAQNKSTCALFDTNRFCRHIETAYRIMWDRWLAGDKPKGFAVPAAD